jgi:hypothetical protein
MNEGIIIHHQTEPTGTVRLNRNHTRTRYDRWKSCCMCSVMCIHSPSFDSIHVDKFVDRGGRIGRIVAVGVDSLDGAIK